MVQVCLDHAAHIYIWEVKNTESKHSASETISWSLLVVHVQGHCQVMPCTRQLLLLQPINVHHTLGYQNVLGQVSQTHSNTAMHGTCPHAAMRGQTDTDSTDCDDKVCDVHAHYALHTAQCWLHVMHTRLQTDQLTVSDAECFDSVFFTFHMQMCAA